MGMALKIQNFGPVRKGEVELCPLTVLIGPNNTGKSVVAMLSYSATANAPRALLYRYMDPMRRTVSRKYRRLVGLHEQPPRAVQEQAVELVASLHGSPSSPPLSLKRELRQYLIAGTTAWLSTYAEDFSEELERAFGAKLRDLTRTQGGRHMPAALTIESDNPPWKVQVSFVRGVPHVELLWDQDIGRVFAAFQRAQSKQVEPRRAPARFQPGELLEWVAQRFFDEFPAASYYLPAARSGILQSHRALASSVMRNAPLVGIEEMQVPKISGVLADFISQLLTIGRRRSGHFNQLAGQLEQAVLQGKIRLEEDPSTYPEISYETRGVNFPLHRTSSMISELAPVVLYLRYVLRRDDLLIIEEPESHLHPESQVQFARVIAELVNQDLHIVLTTHSDYFLQQLNNSMLLGQLRLRGEDPPPSAHNLPSLPTTRVSAYLFNNAQGTPGTLIQRLQVTEHDGILAEDFHRVAESLYQQTMELDRLVGE